MQKGYLSQYFEGVAVKALSAVDAEAKSSNQHEIGTTVAMRKRFLGANEEKFNARFLWLGDGDEGISEYGTLTHYDCRKLQRSRGPEWRLYYTTNAVTSSMNEGDTLFIAKRTMDNELLLIVCAPNTTIENKLKWLFGISSQTEINFEVKKFIDNNDPALDFATRFVLDEIGIELENPVSNEIETLIEPFSDGFPTTFIFSQTARISLPEVSALDDPDLALIAWLDHEEKMFRALEAKIVDSRLREGFAQNDKTDVDGFIKFSLSVLNTRKSRMGYSFEHHISAVLDAYGVKYVRGAQTENKSKPDFLFPSIKKYNDFEYDANNLFMLGAKSTCKDRWRQVLTEANRIKNKHLITLEPSISVGQTNEMKANNLSLVVPTTIRKTYKESQRGEILNLSDFVKLVSE